MKRYLHKWLFIILNMMLIATSFIMIRNIFSKPTERTADTHMGTVGRVYYLLNIDGMKGLGHSALLLQDSEGQAQVFSYNGMQYNFRECLLGKSGIGKMKQFQLNAEELKQLLETGDLQADKYEECDNFDRALYCDITQEQYATIMEEIRHYIEVGDTFEQLYMIDKIELESFLNQKDIPKYQIYTHNCDTVAREILALISKEVEEYNADFRKLTPGGNYKEMCKVLGNDWGVIKLGEDSVWENILSDY